MTRFIVFSLFLFLISGCGHTYNIKDHSPVEFSVYSMDVPSFLDTRVAYTRINDAILRELPKSKIDTSQTVKGIAAKILFEICRDASKCRLVSPEELPTDTIMAGTGLPTNLSMVREGDMFKGAAFETDLGYIWMNYLKPVPMEAISSDIKLTQKNYKTTSAAAVGSYRTRYGAIEPVDKIKYWQTMVQGKNSSGSQELSVYYASEVSDSDKKMIDLTSGSFTYALFGSKAEYTRKRTVCGLEGTEWMAEGALPHIRYYNWFFVGEVPDVGKVRFEITLKGPLTMEEDWHEAIWNFILNSMRLQAVN